MDTHQLEPKPINDITISKSTLRDIGKTQKRAIMLFTNSVTYRQSTVFLSLSLSVLPNNLMSRRRRENFSLADVLDSSLAGSDCHSQNANDQTAHSAQTTKRAL